MTTQAVPGTVVPSGAQVSPGGGFGPQGGTGPIGNTGGIGPPFQAGGILKYVSATQLSFTPFNGSQIQINGSVYNIPSAGIAGLNNTNVYIDGAAGQNLAINTNYYVYCWNNAGVLTGEFSTTGHATSSTAGNVGTEIKSGDDTRTLIGLIRTGGTALFFDTTGNRWVRSWFNRNRASFVGSTSGGFAGATSAATSATANFLAFANEAVVASGCCFGTGTVVANYILSMNLDTVSISQSGVSTTGTTAKYESTAVCGAWVVSEGLHTVTLYATMSSGTFNGNWWMNGLLG
jgi:hypothetical protein